MMMKGTTNCMTLVTAPKICRSESIVLEEEEEENRKWKIDDEISINF